MQKMKASNRELILEKWVPNCLKILRGNFCFLFSRFVFHGVI